VNCIVISINDKPIIEPYTVYVEEVSFERFLEFANEDIACELVPLDEWVRLRSKHLQDDKEKVVMQSRAVPITLSPPARAADPRPKLDENE
jgi:hypothetical protein